MSAKLGGYLPIDLFRKIPPEKTILSKSDVCVVYLPSTKNQISQSVTVSVTTYINWANCQNDDDSSIDDSVSH